MLLIPRILLHALVILDALEDYLTEAVEVGHVAHLRVEELRHEGPRGGLVVDLWDFVFVMFSIARLMKKTLTNLVQFRDFLEKDWGQKLTCVHLLIPYLAMRPLVIGAEMLTMWLR